MLDSPQSNTPQCLIALPESHPLDFLNLYTLITYKHPHHTITHENAPNRTNHPLQNPQRRRPQPRPRTIQSPRQNRREGIHTTAPQPYPCSNPVFHGTRLIKEKQDGKPYIVSAAVGKSIPDPRNKGFNLSVKTTFASLEDMQYYDQECEAHKALKAVVGAVREEVLSTYYENIL